MELYSGTFWLKQGLSAMRQEAITLTIVETYLSYHMSPRILVITATNRNGQNLNGHKPKRRQTRTATDRNGHKPERPQTGTATHRNGHKHERPQTETATNQNGQKPERPQTKTATNRKGHKLERPQIEIDTSIYDSALTNLCAQ